MSAAPETYPHRVTLATITSYELVVAAATPLEARREAEAQGEAIVAGQTGRTLYRTTTIALRVETRRWIDPQDHAKGFAWIDATPPAFGV